MDNKLSELSRPVGRFAFEPLEERWHHIKHGEKKNLEGGPWDLKKLYSQEYVSALTQRIAELEHANKSQDDHINQQQDRIDSLEKTNAGLGRRLGDAEKRLATPVRLKKVDSSNVPYAGDGFNAAVDYCADAVRAAGFTVTVEGDE